MDPSRSRKLVELAVLAVALALFAAHASVYAAWLIDDAGISIAYATNLVHGHGLVAQPGDAPVEGFTNPAWVALLAIAARLGVASLVGWVKSASIVLVAASYAVLLAIASRVAQHRVIVGAAVLVFCSLNPSFVVWCTSGLENPLYVLSIALLAWATILALDGGPSALAVCGALAALVAWTRPDGVLFALAPPALALATDRADRRALGRYALAFGVPLVALVVARLAVFHHLLPNTYAAKGGLRASDALEMLFFMPNGVAKLEEVLDEAFAGIVTNLVLVAAIVCARLVIKRRAFTAAHGVVVTFALVALADYMLLPRDRMREHRFATAFYPLYYLAVFSLLDAALAGTTVRRKGLSIAAIAGSLAVASFPDFAGRALSFAHRPSIGLYFVKRAFAERIDRYADALGVKDGSVLLPDVGGMLLWSKLHVVDLGGLCDETLARTLFHDPKAAREYVLGTVRPTFIHAADVWASAAAFEQDPRFAADYVAIHAYDAIEDPPSAGHASGLFVRKDAVTSEAALDALRAERHVRLGFLPPPANSLVLRWLDRASFIPLEYRRAAAATSPVSIADHV